MTDLQNLLDQIDRLDQEATKGPWHSHFGGNPGDKWLSVEPEIGSRTICTVTDEHKPNAVLIAQARTLLPQLAKALGAVEQECRRMAVESSGSSDMWDNGRRAAVNQIRQAIADAMEGDDV